MGNCLVITPDGIKRIGSSVGVDQDLKGKRPLKAASPGLENHVKVLKNIKKVRFADHREYLGDQDEGDDNNRASRTVRIKVVISKRELLEMIERGGVTVGDDAVNHTRLLIEGREGNCADDGFEGWKPGLESTSEAI